MATILLVFIYIFYIGLGIPDSLLGAAWPAIYGDLSVQMCIRDRIAGSVLKSPFFKDTAVSGRYRRVHFYLL